MKISNKEKWERENLNWIWFLMIFLFSINFMNFANIFLLCLLISGLIIVGYKGSTFQVTWDFLLIILFSLIYFLFIYNYNSVGLGSILTYLIGPISIFSIGFFITTYNKVFIIKSLYIMVISNFIYGLLNMFVYLKTYGSNSVVRMIPDFWSGIEKTATLQGTYFTLSSSLLFIAILLMRDKSITKKIYSIILFMCFFSSIYFSFILGNRTLVITSLIIFILNVKTYLLLNIKDILLNLKIIFSVVFIGCLLYILFAVNYLGIKDFVINSNFYSRLNESSLVDDPRFDAFGKAINQMFIYPLGGYKMDLGLSYAHNLWFDVLFATGIIPFFILVLISIRNINNVLLIIFRSKDTHFALLLLSLLLGYLLNFMVEPILEGAPYLFLSYCLFVGMITKYQIITKIKLRH